MPGIIQVSVLSFIGSQSSSPTPQMSIKVSMGKREYQTWDKGDFSFPVTTLRDSLIVTLLDSEGNELSSTGLETRLVIEKGTWEDTFSLEGGGQVHMKLQFVLNEEDRQRIRTMRETALRKKHEELVNSKPRRPEYSTKPGSDAVSSSHRNHEVSDPEKCSLQGKLDQAGLTCPKGKSGADNGQRTHSVEKQMNPNDTDRYEHIWSTSSASEGFDVQPKKVMSGSLNEKGAVGAFGLNSPSQKVFPEEASYVGSSGSVAAAKGKVSLKHGDGVTDPGNQRAEQKHPSKVRNMISAFEISHNQDMRPKTRPVAIKSQSSKTGGDSTLEGSYSDKFKAENIKSGDSIQWTVKNNPDAGNVKLPPIPIRDKEELLDLRASQIQTKGNNVDLKDRVKVLHKELNVSEDKMTSEHSARSSMGERSSVSGRVHYEQLGKHSNLFTRKQHSGSHFVRKNNKNGSQENVSQNLDIQGSCRDELYSSEHSGAWIFPAEGKHFCITTGNKQLINLIESCQAAAKGLPGMVSSFVKGNLKESIEHVSDGVESRKGENSCQRLINPETDGSPEAENRPGLLGQVMKVAIIVGFATLVFFTRQKSPDPKKAKGAKSTE